MPTFVGRQFGAGDAHGRDFAVEEGRHGADRIVRDFAGHRMNSIQATKADARAIGVVVERIESKLEALTEGLSAVRDELKADMSSLEIRLSTRISVLEEAVRKNSEDIRRNSDESDSCGPRSPS